MRRIPVRLLLIEDAGSEAELFKERSKDTEILDIEVVHFQWLQPAIKCAKEDPFDIVFLDLSLPGSVGLGTLAEFIRNVPNVPVVVYSGHPDLHMAAKAIRAGADSFVYKNDESRHGRLERAVLYAIERNQSDIKRKRLLLEARARLAEEKQEAVKIDVLEPHLRSIEHTLDSVISYATAVMPERADDFVSLIENGGGLVACQELRSLFHLQSKERKRPISERALAALREVGGGVEVSTPEAAKRAIADSALNFDEKVWGTGGT